MMEFDSIFNDCTPASCNNSNSSSVTLESLTKTMNEMREKFPPKPPMVIVGSYLVKEWFDHQARTEALNRPYGSHLEFYPTEIESLANALMHHSQGYEVWLIKDSGEMHHYLPAKSPLTISAMIDGQWEKLGTTKSIQIQVDGLSRNQLKRQQKRLALIGRYARSRTLKKSLEVEAVLKCRLMHRWGIPVAPIQIKTTADFDVMFEPRMLASLCVW